MEYKFSNQTMPNHNSLVLYRLKKNNKNINTICAVIDVNQDKMILLGLDNNAIYTVNKNDNWMKLDIYDLETLREYYNLIILNTNDNDLPKIVCEEKDIRKKIINYVKQKYDKYNGVKKMI
jgi:siroheme synthase (precorrin-2 oxidase/ferrochelatase)